jgi:hypothetical protein
MDDPPPMRLVQGVCDLNAAAQRLLERQRPVLQPVRQGLPLQVLHDQVLGFGLAADVVQGANVGVRELRDRLRLALEALAVLG